jgi:hypothetical protein
MGDFGRWPTGAARAPHLAPDLLVATLACTGTFAVLSASIGGLYRIAGAMVIATTSGLVNSWVLLVEIKR